MFRDHLPRRTLQHLLPLILALSALIASPSAALGQESRHDGAPVPIFDTGFDHLNDSLGATADHLLADAVIRSRRLVNSSGAVRPEVEPARRLSNAGSVARSSHARARLDQLRPIIEPIFRREGVPAELVAVALVESGGQLTALSPKGARGVWQLMPDTARRYGLVVSEQKDERLDLVIATQAAAHYLHDLYAQFGDWQLALAAYNVGEKAVDVAIRRAKSNSFAVLSQLRFLPAETRMYVPAVLTASGMFTQRIGESGGKLQKQTNGIVVFALIASDTRIAADGADHGRLSQQ